MANFNDISRRRREIMIGQIQIGQTQIGDYADIIYANDNDIYRYYIIKIGDNNIDICQVNNPNEKLFLIRDTTGISWKIKDYIGAHTITFSKNATETRYFERDYGKKPTKSIIIDDYDVSRGDFTELNNGIILWDINGDLRFIDPNEIKEDKAVTFLEVPLFDEKDTDNTIMNFSKNDRNLDDSDEIFIFDDTGKTTNKLNLNDFTLTEYEKNPQISHVFPLENKKILYVLEDSSMYIFDLITKKRIAINNMAPPSLRWPAINQFSDENIILKYWIQDPISDKFTTELYHVDIKNGSLRKLISLNYWAYIIAVLKNNSILLCAWGHSSQTLRIEILNPASNQIVQIFTTKLKSISDSRSGVILPNGNVLMYIDKKTFYLFDYITRQIKIIPLFSKRYSSEKEFLIFRRLKNGNLIMKNDEYFTILEFPYSQRQIDILAYDEISFSIKLPLDIKNLIREFL